MMADNQTTTNEAELVTDGGTTLDDFDADSAECSECAKLADGWPCAECYISGDAELPDEQPELVTDGGVDTHSPAAKAGNTDELDRSELRRQLTKKSNVPATAR